MNILITGGAGFIGSHVVRRFVNQYPQYNIVNFIGVTVRVACPEHGDPEHGKLLPGEKVKGGHDDDDDDYDDEDGAEDTTKELK